MKSGGARLAALKHLRGAPRTRLPVAIRLRQATDLRAGLERESRVEKGRKVVGKRLLHSIMIPLALYPEVSWDLARSINFDQL